MNDMLTLMPSYEEIKVVVFSLSRNGIVDLYGYDSIFFQSLWHIIKKEVSDTIVVFG